MTIAGHKILVVGAGIGGLAAAIGLRARGADVTVLEQSDAISEVGAGLQISPNGAVVLRALGIEPVLSQNSVLGRAVVLRDYQRSGDVMRMDLTQLGADQRYHFVHRADLITSLADAARKAGVSIRLSQSVTVIEPGQLPVAHLADGTRLQADLIVGADGIHSKARVALNGADTPFFTGQVAWRAIVPNDLGVPDEVRVVMAPGQHLVSYPLRNSTLVNLVAVQERKIWADEGWHHQDDPNNLRAAFAGFTGEAKALLSRVESVGLWGLFRHPVAASWQQNGVAILGDAAHPTLPFLAQGANMALEDAWILSDSLAAAENVTAGLARYQDRRHDRVTKVIAAANGNAWKYHLRAAPVRRAAHLALHLGGKVAPGLMLRQFDWLYRYDVTA